MENNGYAIIFDTNSYREFVLNKNKDEIENDLEKLLNCESNLNIDCYASSIVQMELLKHFDDDIESNSFRNCVDAALFMNRHCLIPKTNTTRICPPFYYQLCSTLFLNKYNEDYFRKLSQCINDFYHDYNKALSHHYELKTFINIKKYIEQKKEEFIKGIEDILESFINIVISESKNVRNKYKIGKVVEFINSNRFENEFSYSIIEKISIDLIIKLTQNEINYYANQLLSNFPILIKFYRYILIKIIEDNIDLHSNKSKKSRWNWFMDYNLCAFVNHHTIQNKKMIIVTKDKDIRNVIPSDEVMDIDEYLKFVKFY